MVYLTRSNLFTKLLQKNSTRYPTKPNISLFNFNSNRENVSTWSECTICGHTCSFVLKRHLYPINKVLFRPRVVRLNIVRFQQTYKYITTSSLPACLLSSSWRDAWLGIGDVLIMTLNQIAFTLYMHICELSGSNTLQRLWQSFYIITHVQRKNGFHRSYTSSDSQLDNLSMAVLRWFLESSAMHIYAIQLQPGDT